MKRNNEQAAVPENTLEDNTFFTQKEHEMNQLYLFLRQRGALNLPDEEQSEFQVTSIL